MHDHRSWMAAALDQARKAPGSASPNPRVGALVVKEGKLIAAGYHKGPGHPHAEAVALEAAGEKARGADLYCTLEPCCHDGPGKRTPPCVPKILQAGIARVYCGTRDPNPQVSGKGIAQLQAAGVEVTEGILSRECVALNEGFFVRQLTGLPLVHLKIAQTLSGQMAPLQGPSGKISGAESLSEVQELRRLSDAVAVGAGTLRADDPLLTPRPPSGESVPEPPLRVVVAGQTSLDPQARLFTSPGGPVVVYLPKSSPLTSHSFPSHVRLKICEGHPFPDLREVLMDLGARGVNSLLLEGGAALAASFLDQGLVNRLTVITTPVFGGKGLSPLTGGRFWKEKRLKYPEVRQVGEDVWTTGLLETAGMENYWEAEVCSLV